MSGRRPNQKVVSVADLSPEESEELATQFEKALQSLDADILSKQEPEDYPYVTPALLP